MAVLGADSLPPGAAAGGPRTQGRDGGAGQERARHLHLPRRLPPHPREPGTVGGRWHFVWLLRQALCEEVLCSAALRRSYCPPLGVLASTSSAGHGTARHTVCRRHGTRTPALHRRLHSNALHPTHPPSCLQQVMAQVAGTVRSWFRIGFHIHVKSMSYGSSLNLRPVHFG